LKYFLWKVKANFLRKIHPELAEISALVLFVFYMTSNFRGGKTTGESNIFMPITNALKGIELNHVELT
jgi:hypothetical protein